MVVVAVRTYLVPKIVVPIVPVKSSLILIVIVTVFNNSSITLFVVTFDCLPAMYISKIAGASIQFFNKENDFNLLSIERVSFIYACTSELRKKILNELDIT